MERQTCTCDQWIHPRVLALVEFFRARKVEEPKGVRFYSIEKDEEMREAA